jgi:hypothetical protein
MEGASLLHDGNVTEFKMYGSQKSTGIGVQLTGWSHPVVVDAESGQIQYDNYGGRWGKQIVLDEFVQTYNREATKEEALLHGYPILQENYLENGDLELTLQDFS